MKKILLFLLLFILTSGCAKQEAVEKVNPDQEEKILDLSKVEEMVESCLEASYKNASEGLNMLLTRNDCYLRVAIKFEDALVCEKIENEPEKKDQCLNEIGRLTKDIALCEKIVSNHERSHCYYSLGQGLNDFTICEKITDNHLREDCYKNAGLQNMDIIACESENMKNDKDFCIFTIATTNKNAAECKNISNNVRSHEYTINGEYAIDSCVEYIAKKSKNPLDCSYMEDKYDKMDCYRIYAKFSNKSIEYCNNEINDSMGKDVCLSTVASEKVDYSICMNIVDNNIRSGCRSSIDRILKN